MASLAAEFGSWKADGVARHDPALAETSLASRRAHCPHVGANVPDHGRSTEWMRTTVSEPSRRPRSRIMPNVSSVHEPSASQRCFPAPRATPYACASRGPRVRLGPGCPLPMLPLSRRVIAPCHAPIGLPDPGPPAPIHRSPRLIARRRSPGPTAGAAQPGGGSGGSAKRPADDRARTPRTRRPRTARPPAGPDPMFEGPSTTRRPVRRRPRVRPTDRMPRSGRSDVAVERRGDHLPVAGEVERVRHPVVGGHVVEVMVSKAHGQGARASTGGPANERTPTSVSTMAAINPRTSTRNRHNVAATSNATNGWSRYR